MVAFCLRASSVLSLVLFLAASAGAQDPDLQLSVAGPSTLQGNQSFSTSILLDNNSPTAEIAGWSYGVCHDPALLQLDGSALGATSLIAKAGAPVDFQNFTAQANGFTAGALICFSGCATLPPGTPGAELRTADYTLLVPTPLATEADIQTSLSLCETLGSPPIPVVLTVGGNSITPTQTNLDITVPRAPDIDPNYVLRLVAPTALARTGDAVSVSVRVDNTGQNVAGWSYGVCVDPAVVAVDSLTDGILTQVIKNGAPADFIDNQVYVDGVTSGVVVCFDACAFLLPGTSDAEVSSLNLTAIATPPLAGPVATATLDFCETLGVGQPVGNVVTVGGNSITPTTVGTSFDIESVPPTSFVYSVDPIAPRYFVPSNPVATPFDAHIRIEQTGVDAPIETQGFSMGLSHDPAMIDALSIEQGDALLALAPGGPEFYQPALRANGWTAAVVYSISTVVTVNYAPSQEVLRIGYTTVASGFAGVETFQNVPLTWDDTLGAPPVQNVVVLSDGTGTFPNQIDGIVPMEPQFSGGYIRGDANGDGELALTDAIWLLDDLFVGGPTTRDICFAANDVNSDELIHLADPIFLLNYLFVAGPQPGAPFPACGITTIADCELPGFCAP